MTPDRRLDQLEPLMADSLQKIDRLIEGQGKLVELATNTDQKVDAVDRKADPLIQGDPNVEEHEGQTEGIDDRRGEQVEHASVPEKRRDPLLDLLVRVPHFLVEPDPSLMEAVSPPLLLVTDVF